jgi:hypothetical protein
MSVHEVWVNSEDLEDMAAVEAYLQSLLEPVTPRALFVKNLRDRVFGRKELDAPGLELDLEPSYALIAGAGILSSVLILITGIRALITLKGTIGALRRVKSQVAQKQSAPLSPAA